MTQRIISWILSVLLLAAVGAGAASARVLNVRDFGAKGDGVTDDTKAINAAIAAGVSQGPGTRVLVPTGQYLLLSPTEGAHVHIRRANGLTFEGHKGAVLLADDPNAHIIDLSDSKNTTIRNLTL